MANNRMMLVCNICRGINKPLYYSTTPQSKRGIFFLAKWYPSLGWGRSGKNREEGADFYRRFDAWLDKHRHENKGSDEYRFRLIYEFDNCSD